MPISVYHNIILHESFHSLSAFNNNYFLIVVQNISKKPFSLYNITILGVFENIEEKNVLTYDFIYESNVMCSFIKPYEDVIKIRIDYLSTILN